MARITKENKNSEDKKPSVGRCIDCARGYVMSDGIKGNPLITECGINKIRYSQSWLCPLGAFLQRKGELVIHPMIYINRKK